MSEDIQAKVIGLIKAKLHVEESRIVPSASFAGDLEADSLDLVELVLEMEKQFDLDINDDDAEKIKTVQDAIDYIKTHYTAA